MPSMAAVGSDPDSVGYGGGLAQRTLLEIGRAADDLVVIFGVGSADVAAQFTVWAVREAKQMAVQLRRNAMAAHAASASGLAPTMQVGRATYELPMACYWGRVTICLVPRNY